MLAGAAGGASVYASVYGSTGAGAESLYCMTKKGQDASFSGLSLSRWTLWTRRKESHSPCPRAVVENVGVVWRYLRVPRAGSFSRKLCTPRSSVHKLDAKTLFRRPCQFFSHSSHPSLSKIHIRKSRPQQDGELAILLVMLV